MAAFVVCGAVAAQAQARSADACDPIESGVVVCRADPDLFPEGLRFDQPTPGDLTIVLEPGVEIAPVGSGLIATAGQGSVIVRAGGASVATTAGETAGVLATSGQGDVTVEIGAVTTQGFLATGVAAYAADGNVSVDAGLVFAGGFDSWGVSGVSDQGNVSIAVADLINVTGGEYNSTAGGGGIKATAADGDIDVAIGNLTLFGDNKAGLKLINITEDGVTTAHLGTAMIDGTGTTAIDVDVTGSASVSADSIIAYGDQSFAIHTITEKGTNAVSAGEIFTSGYAGVGVLADSLQGDVKVSVGSIATSGDVADAIIARTVFGDVTVDARDIHTAGYAAWGVTAQSLLGQTSVSVDRIETERDEGVGAVVGGGAGSSFAANELVTHGYGATGLSMIAGNFDGDLVTFGTAQAQIADVTTFGQYSSGAAVLAIGNADVRIGKARTYGVYSHGLDVYALSGGVRARVDEVRTSGEGARGVLATSDYGDIALSVGSVSTEGLFAAGVSARSVKGGISIALDGSLSTRGDDANGITAGTAYGDVDVTALGAIQTAGVRSAGVYVAAIGRSRISVQEVRTAGADAFGVHAASAGNGEGEAAINRIDISAASVSTLGDRAHGILADNVEALLIPVVSDNPFETGEPIVSLPGPADRDIVIRAGTVSAAGLDAAGIVARGIADVTVTARDVTSRESEALRIDAREDAMVNLTGAISGAGLAAADIKGGNVVVTIGAGSVVQGLTSGLRLAAVGPYVPSDDDGGWGLGVLEARSSGLATLDNAGVIRSAGGPAIRVTDGTAVIRNSGRIEGALTLADGDDTVSNTGTLLVVSDSDFGTGSDLFSNDGGIVRLGAAATPLDVTFRNLERFVNAGGLVDLRNGRAGDRLTLDGAYAGTGDARLALDVDGGVADSLVVAGSATGKTAVMLSAADPAKARLISGSPILISAGSGSAADAFVIAQPDQGLVRYGLTWDAARRGYVVQSSAGQAVHQALRAGEGLRNAWRASAQAFSAEQTMARTVDGESGRVWAQAYGATLDRDGDTAGFDLDYRQDWIGGQMGATLMSKGLAGGEAVAGLTAGYVDSTLEYSGQGPSMDAESFNLGVYGVWHRDGLFATGLIKVDQHRQSIDDNAAGYEAEIDGRSWGAQVELGYRFAMGPVVFEPAAALEWLQTDLDDLSALDQTVVFDDRNGLSGRIGGQALTHGDIGGRAVTFSAGLEAVHDFDPEESGSLVSGGLSDAVALDAPETFGRVLVGAEFQAASGIDVYVQGEGRFGDDQSGGGLRLGVRYRF